MAKLELRQQLALKGKQAVDFLKGNNADVVLVCN